MIITTHAIPQPDSSLIFGTAEDYKKAMKRAQKKARDDAARALAECQGIKWDTLTKFSQTAYKNQVVRVLSTFRDSMNAQGFSS